MKYTLALLVLIGTITSFPHNEDQIYEGAQVFRITPESSAQAEFLKQIFDSGKLDFWSERIIIGQHVDVMATRTSLSLLKKKLVEGQFNFELLIPDLHKLIKENRERNHAILTEDRNNGLNMSWNTYQDYDDIMSWVDQLAETYPDLVTVETVGHSFENRSMKLVKISTGGEGKPAVFTDAGIHAREWVSPATVTYIMNELLVNSGNYTDLLNKVDLYFMPLINPDGYQYSRDSKRYWRKTKSVRNGTECIGVDPNRNWDFHWMESGSSQDPCVENYAGPEPFSEVEMRVVRDQILSRNETIKVYLTFHSYGQLWMYPWGYAPVVPDDVDELDSLAETAVNALTAVHGTQYLFGSIVETIFYTAAGGSTDYTKGVAGIKHSYAIELRDIGRYGFELPPEQIIPTGEETLAGFLEIVKFLKETY